MYNYFLVPLVGLPSPRLAKAEGDAIGLSVFLGMELRTEESSNDYLLFGVTEEFVYDNPRLYEWKMADVCKLTKEYGILIFQAHPYRGTVAEAMIGRPLKRAQMK